MLGQQVTPWTALADFHDSIGDLQEVSRHIGVVTDSKGLLMEKTRMKYMKVKKLLPHASDKRGKHLPGQELVCHGEVNPKQKNNFQKFMLTKFHNSHNEISTIHRTQFTAN